MASRALGLRRHVLLPAAIAAAVLGLGSLAGALLRERPPVLVPRTAPAGSDPLAWSEGAEPELERNAAAGLARPLFARSPGGVVATAERVARFRPLVEAAVEGSGFSADTLEALVFLESAGRPDAIAGDDPAAAAGLAQIVAETGTSFLGLAIDLEESRRLTRAIGEAATEEEADRLRARRAQADPRFDPERALRAAVRYLVQARELLGRNDLALASYHMGIGNLRGVLERFGEGADVSWTRLFFDSSPARHAEAWTRLSELGDDTRNYRWKVLAAEQVMRLHRTDPERLAALADLHARAGSAEHVLRPPGTPRFADGSELERAWRRRVLHPVPGGGGLGLRAEALAVLLHLTHEVRALSGDDTPLVVTAAAADAEEAGRGAHELHATGYAFDLSRAWGSDRQAGAMQFALERLQAHGVIAWVREPDTIHVVAGPLAVRLVERYLRPEADK